MTPLLELKGVSKVFSHGMFNRHVTVALDDVSFVVPADPPRIIAIAGESGSGKTTLARLLLGMEKPITGRTLWRGRDITGLPASARRALRRDVQPIFQDPFEAYNPFYRVDHVLAVPMRRLRLAASNREARQMIRDAVEQVGLMPDEILGRYPHELSGGQRQRLMAARALLIRPRAILADEPVSMVDASLRATILESLRDLHRRHGISLIYVTHDLTTAFQISDAIIILYRGRIVEAGPAETVIRAPAHPYTRLLVDSIPRLDPDLRWSDTATQSATGHRMGTGCAFAQRCPSVMPRCRAEMPPLFDLGGGRAARCFISADRAVVSDDRLARGLAGEALAEAA